MKGERRAERGRAERKKLLKGEPNQRESRERAKGEGRRAKGKEGGEKNRKRDGFCPCRFFFAFSCAALAALTAGLVEEGSGGGGGACGSLIADRATYPSDCSLAVCVCDCCVCSSLLQVSGIQRAHRHPAPRTYIQSRHTSEWEG